MLTVLATQIEFTPTTTWTVESDVVDANVLSTIKRCIFFAVAVELRWLSARVELAGLIL